MAFSKATEDIFQVSGSESTKTGVAPWYSIGLALATKVKLEHKTMSPVLTPKSLKAK